METFSALLALCAENSPATAEFPSQRPVTRSFDVFFDLRVNKRLSKRLWGWWFETPSRSLWRHCNATRYLSHDPALFWTHTFFIPCRNNYYYWLQWSVHIVRHYHHAWCRYFLFQMNRAAGLCPVIVLGDHPKEIHSFFRWSRWC